MLTPTTEERKTMNALEALRQKAEAVCPDEVLNGLTFEPLDPLAAWDALHGCTIIGAEPVDYPLTDGLEVYLESRTGERLVLRIDAGEESDGVSWPSLVMSCAKLPTR